MSSPTECESSLSVSSEREADEAPRVEIEEAEGKMASSSTSIKHLLHCALLLTVVALFCWFNGALRLSNWNPRLSHIDPVEKYGLWGAVFLYVIRALPLLVLPQILFNFVGLLFYNVFPEKVVLKGSPLLAPMICFRVVTRGDYPELVRQNVLRNINTVLDTGIENFIVEVVTDKSIDLPQTRRTREIVVPKTYKTRTNALYKARALQYCLEDKVNELHGTDYIVHLDEETLLTANSVRGIVNFVLEGKHQFGQGLITYANDKIVNWITTLADSGRVADDMGKLRLQFRKFHKPLFSFKGSYVVSRADAERAVSFDNGPAGSIAEDCYFAMVASSQGYTFDFVEGEMYEKSPFTFMDFIQQRKRWIQGLLLVVHANQIPWRTKFWLATSVYASVFMPVTLSNFVLSIVCPVPHPLIMDVLVGWLGGMGLYMYIFGVIKSFSLSRSLAKTLICVVCVVLVMPLIIILESIACVWGVFGRKNKFHVVQKSIDGEKAPIVTDNV